MIAVNRFLKLLELKNLIIGVMVLMSIGLGSILALGLDQRTLFLPGETSVGHYLFEESCNSCHDGFKPVSNETCLRCHQAELEDDAHGPQKFRDPRWAGELANLDALTCTACHQEHVHMYGRGVHLQPNLCMACHATIPEGELKSHEGFDPGGCWAAGCHNYHDHRAISTGFLRNGIGQPDMLPELLWPERIITLKQAVPAEPDLDRSYWETGS